MSQGVFDRLLSYQMYNCIDETRKNELLQRVIFLYIEPDVKTAQSGGRIVPIRAFLPI